LNNKGQMLLSIGMHDYWAANATWDKGELVILEDPVQYEAYARGLNQKGQVVGSFVYNVSTGLTQAAFWENGILYRLETLGERSSSATAINARGQVVGASTNSFGTRAFLWNGK
jgi:probable HAF family extracellular repeat protein